MGVSPLGGFNPSQLISQTSPIPATVGPGSAAKDVHGVQESLKELGYKVEAKEDKADTYGTSTQAAVSQFQKDHKLPVTGVADGQTQLSIAQAIQQAIRHKEEAERALQQALAEIQKAKSFFTAGSGG